MLAKTIKTDNSARHKFYLAREYYYKGRMNEALDMFQQYSKDSKYLAEKADAFLFMTKILWSLNRGSEARAHCLNAILCNPNFKEAFIWMSKMTFPKQSKIWLKMAENATNEDVIFIRS